MSKVTVSHFVDVRALWHVQALWHVTVYNDRNGNLEALWLIFLKVYTKRLMINLEVPRLMDLWALWHVRTLWQALWHVKACINRNGKLLPVDIFNSRRIER